MNKWRPNWIKPSDGGTLFDGVSIDIFLREYTEYIEYIN